MTQRLIAPCFKPRAPNADVEVEIDDVIRNLLLFDEFILQSSRLREFPGLVSAFGYDGLRLLLESGRLKIHCQATAFGQTGQLELVRGPEGKKILPINSFSFSVLRTSDRKKYIHDALQNLHQADARQKEIIKLKQGVIKSMVEWPEDVGSRAAFQLLVDLRANGPILKSAVAFGLKKEFCLEPTVVREIECRVEEIADGDFRVESNLGSYGLDKIKQHTMFERCLLGLAGLNQRIEEMDTYRAISGFLELECPLFSDRLGFLLEAASPHTQYRSCSRVVEIAGLPRYIDSLDRINVPRLLELLESRECTEFRQWLETLSSATDADIADRVASLRARIGAALGTRSGRAVRFLASTGIGLLGTAAGVASGAIDSFLIERLLPSSGVWTFVNKTYPSIFDSKEGQR